ncbi:MAG: hypothetical protein ACN4GR_00050 [Arenicellales bacterium]
MKDIGELFLIGFWLFGALCFWPVMRFLVKFSVDRLRGLKWQFWLQVIGLAATFGLVHYYRVAGYRGWLHALMLPYIVGFLGWAVALLLLMLMGHRRRGSASG